MSTSENPFTPPSADVSGARPPGSPIVAVVVGTLADIVGTVITSSIFYGFVGAALVAGGVAPEELEQAMLNPAAWYSIVGYAIGTFFSFLGGYVCGRMARRSELQLASVVAVLATAFGLFVGGSSLSVTLNVVLVAATFAAALFGASRAAARNRRLGYARS